MFQARVLGVATCALLLCGAPAWAQHAANNGKRPDKPAETPASGGMTAAVDQEGKLRPISHEEMQVLLAGMGKALSQDAAGLVPVYHANGAVSIDLDGGFESVVLARTTVDGKAVAECVTNKDEAAAFLSKDTVKVSKAGPVPQQKPGAATPAKNGSTPQLEEK